MESYKIKWVQNWNKYSKVVCYYNKNRTYFKVVGNHAYYHYRWPSMVVDRLELKDMVWGKDWMITWITPKEKYNKYKK